MEFFSAAWWTALLAIILIDLVLAGDNAIVIALAARNLPQKLQRKAIIWGTVGAIVVRSAMTVGVVWLLQVPGLMLVGGLGLVWIAYKLLADEGDGKHHGPVASTFWGAMKTIVVFGSTMVLKLVERFPIVIQAGAAVLAFTAAKMIVDEPLLSDVFDYSVARWATYAVAVVGVLGAGWWATNRRQTVEREQDEHASHAA